MVKTSLKIMVLGLAAIFLLIQLYRPNRENPPVNPEETIESQMRINDDVHMILKRSCYDCHSNQTNWVWYSNVAPVSWGMVDHVNEGRRELNFSKWATYSPEKRAKKLDEICEQVESGAMPHYQYLWLHSEAKLSAEDVRRLCSWTNIASEQSP